MKVTKKQLEALIQESVEHELNGLNEEELDELLGGLQGLAKGAGAGLKRAGQAVGAVAQRAGNAVKGAVGAVGNAAAGAAGAVKGAYQAGERGAAIQNVKKSIQTASANITKALQTVQGDQNAINDLDNVLQIVNHASQQITNLAEGKRTTKTLK